VVVGPGGLSARTPRNVRVGPTDCPRVDRGPSARSTKLHPVLLGFEENNGPSAWGPWIVYLEAHFLENFCQKSQILNKYQKPADCPPQEPGLSAQHLKTDFKIFNETLLAREIATHLNAMHANFLSKWHHGNSSQ
jgi:hypothetical protein